MEPTILDWIIMLVAMAGVMSFYHDFRDAPAGRHVLKLCRAEACQASGGDRVADHAKQVLGVDWHGTTADGAVTLEPVFCLGLCACGAAAIPSACASQVSRPIASPTRSGTATCCAPRRTTRA